MHFKHSGLHFMEEWEISEDKRQKCSSDMRACASIFLDLIYVLHPRKCGVRASIYGLFVWKPERASEGFLTQTTSEYSPVRHTFYDVSCLLK